MRCSIAWRGSIARTWHDLHVWREWPAEEAIAMGQPSALREVVPVLVDLAHVYLDTLWPGRGRAAAT